MSALTLAMNEVQDVNSEEFPAVRAYHSLGANFRQILFARERNWLSPASSMSSGIESCVTISSEVSDRHLKDIGNDSRNEPEKKCKKDKRKDHSLALIYQGRNILDLGQNIKPFSWQLSTFTQLSSPGFYFFRTPKSRAKALSYVNESIVEHPQETCGNCSFSVPAQVPRVILATKR